MDKELSAYQEQKIKDIELKIRRFRKSIDEYEKMKDLKQPLLGWDYDTLINKHIRYIQQFEDEVTAIEKEKP